MRSEVEVQAFSGQQLRSYITRLSDPNVAVRRGCAAALGALPAWILLPQLGEVGRVRGGLKRPLPGEGWCVWGGGAGEGGGEG